MASAGRNRQVSWALVLVLVFTSVAIAVGAATASDFEPQQQVAFCIARYLQVDPTMIAARLEILAPIRALPPDAGIHVISVKQEFVVGDWLVRMECVTPRACLPFAAVLHAEGLDLARLQWQRHSGVDVGWPHATSSTGPQLARLGEVVELEEELGGISLRTRAVCLESGGMGQKIRVRNLASHRVLEATIAGPGTVRLEQ